MRTLYLVLLAFNLFVFNSFAQSNLATVGREFWIGFMHNYEVAPDDLLKVFVTSPYNTTGTLSIPTTGYTQNFTVTANQTTEIIIPNNIAEHFQSNVIENKGILVETLNDVSVFYLNYENATADGAKILPIQSLGTNYRVMAAVGISTTLNSEMLIVATENGTQVEITPSVNTIGGFNAGIPYTVNLNKGQSYQIKAQGLADLTGSVIKATAASGSCRPFAVFSGSQCTNIPTGCYACDHVCDQSIPVEAWKDEYLVVPFSGPSQYYLRVLAQDNNSIIYRNGVVVATLNAGQYFSQVNTSTSPLFITSNNNISVAQFMTGNTCSNSVGDPAMLLLNSSDQFINDVTFTTIQSSLITDHRLNLISKTPFTNQVSIDGTPLNPAVFTPFPSNPIYSYAQVPLTIGSHTINAPNGIQGYVYGFGNSTYETYAYSLGSSVAQTELNIDTVLCSSDTVTIGNNENLFNTWWSSMSNPTDTILSGTNYYSILPTAPEIYILHGNQFLSGCPIEYLFNVETGEPAFVNITASADTTCLLQPVQLNANVTPPGAYNYLWTPSIGLSDPTIANPIASVPFSVEYTVQVTSVGGCSNATDSVTIAVQSGTVTKFEIQSPDVALCTGDTAHLNVLLEAITASEQFDGSTFGPMIGTNQAVVMSNGCTSTIGNALAFNGAGSRYVATVPLNVSAGGTVKFSIYASDLNATCNATEFGDNLMLEYSITGGASWVPIQTYYDFLYHNWTEINVPIPALAQTPNTIFRWRQVLHDGANMDVWLLDNIFVSTIQTSGYTVSWTPGTNIQTSNLGLNANVFPATTTTYIASYQDVVTGCNYIDSVTVNVDQNFALNTTNDTLFCSLQSLQLHAQPSIPGTYSYEWTPATSLSSQYASNPVTTVNHSITYHVTVESANGCVKNDSVHITFGELYNFNVTPPTHTLCLGDSLGGQLDFSPITCGLASNLCTTQQSVTVGTGTSISSSTANTPFPSYLSAKRQFIITQAELTALGLSGINKIENLAFNIATVGGTGVYQNFTIKIGCTNLSALPSQYIPNLLVVRSPASITLAPGWNTFYFDQGYVWDGVSNLVVEICFNNPVAIPTTSIYYSTVTSGGLYTTGSTTTGVCNDAFGSFTSNRPNLKLGYCAQDSLNGIVYSWTPNYNISATNIPEPIFSPAVTTTYTLVATDSTTGCVYSDNITIAVAPAFDLSTSPDTSVCDVNGLLISAYENSPSPVSYVWSPASSLSSATLQNPVATPFVNTTYHVTATSQEGCVRTDSVKVLVSSLNSFNVTPANSTLCLGDSLQSTLYFAPQTCSITSNDCTPALSTTIGTGTSSSSSTSISPFPNYASAKRQYLVTVANMTAAGITGENILKSLALNISSVGGTGIYQNFSIKISCTNLTGLTSQYVTNLQLVKNSSTITLTPGWNNFVFDQAYAWDGVSNLIVELCYENPSSIAAAGVVYSPGAAIYSNGTSVCGFTSGTQTTNKPNMQFGYCAVDTTNNLSYSWTPNYNISATNIAEPVFWPQVSTTYFVVATDTITGCMYDDSLRINIAPAFDLTTVPLVSLCEVSGISLTANENSVSPVNFTWSPAATLSSATVQNPTANPTMTTTYHVTAVSQEGCSRTDSVKVILNPLYSFNVSPDSSTICVSDSIQSTMTFTPETCRLSFVNCGSTQTVQVGTGTSIGSSSSTTPFPTSSSSKRQYLITQAELAALGLTGVTNLQSLAFNVSTVGGTGVYQNYTIKIGCTNQTSLTTQYIQNLLQAKNPGNITLTAGWNTINFDQSFIWDGISNIVVEVCYSNPSTITGSSIVYSTVAGSGTYSTGTSVCNNFTGTTTSSRPNMKFGYCLPSPTNNLIYAWTPNYNISATNVAAPIFSPYVTTTYHVVATDTISGCVYTDSITINVNGTNDTVNVSAGPDQHYCSTLNQQLSVTNPFTNPIYSWTPANLLNNASIANPTLLYDTTATFIVSVNDAQNCGAAGYDTITITSTGYPDINAGADLTICSGDSIQLSAVSNATVFLWSNGASLSDTTISQPWASPTITTTYTVTATDTNNCSSSDNIQVFVDIFPVINSGSDTLYLCPGDSILLSGGAGFTNYLWSTGSTQQSITVNEAGIYWVETVNACTNARDSIVVEMLVAPTVNLGNDTTICQGSSIILDAGFTAGALYNWSTTANTQTINVSSQNQYWVNVTSSAGCTNSDTIAISVSNPLVNLGNDLTICYGSTVTLNAGLFDSYDWSTNDTTQTISVDSTGAYSVTVTDSMNCTATDQINITVSALPTFTLGNDTSACQGATITLSTNSALSSQWSTGATNTSTISVTTGGTYWATLTNADQCTFTDSINVQFFSLPNLNVGNDLILCMGDSVQLNAVSNASQITWTNATSLSDTNSFQPWASPVVATTYNATVTDTNGCSTSDALQINMTDIDMISLGVDTVSFCQGDSAILTATSGLSNYLWSDNSTGQTLTVNASSIIWVETSNMCGPSRDSVLVIMNPLPQLSIPNEVYVCAGDSVQLNAVTNASSVSWTNESTLSNATIAQPWAFPDTTTVYEITASDNNGCANTQSILVNVLYYPQVDFAHDSLLLCQGTSITLDAGPGFDEYLWQDNSTDQTFTVTEEGLYWASATNDGCGTDSDTVIVELDYCECQLYIPNSFTPGQDKLNSHFYPVSNCDFAELTFTIYNRWGEKIFESNDVSNPWDGTYKGLRVQDGVYTYVITYRFKDDVTLRENGSVTVLR